MALCGPRPTVTSPWPRASTPSAAKDRIRTIRHRHRPRRADRRPRPGGPAAGQSPKAPTKRNPRNLRSLHRYGERRRPSDLALRASPALLTELIDVSDANFVIVSNEVGMGLVPDNKLGRVYRDLLDATNQRLAQHSTEVYLMVSGIPMKVAADARA